MTLDIAARALALALSAAPAIGAAYAGEPARYVGTVTGDDENDTYAYVTTARPAVPLVLLAPAGPVGAVTGDEEQDTFGLRMPAGTSPSLSRSLQSGPDNPS